MPRRDDDENIELFEGLSVDRDDAGYRNRINDRNTAAPGSAARGATRTAPTQARTGRGWLFALVVLLLIAICAGLGYQTLLLQRQVESYQNELTENSKRLDRLNQELFATGSSVTETGTTIEKQFKFFDSEIRKLWDVSNKRNKADIAKNSETMRALSNDLKAASGQIKSRDSKFSSLEKQVSEASSKLKQLSNQLLAENTTLRAGLEDHTEQLLLLRSELETIQSRLKGVPNGLGKRVAANEEAIAAIDAARRQLVSNITQLQERLNQVQGIR